MNGAGFWVALAVSGCCFRNAVHGDEVVAGNQEVWTGSYYVSPGGTMISTAPATPPVRLEPLVASEAEPVATAPPAAETAVSKAKVTRPATLAGGTSAAAGAPARPRHHDLSGNTAAPAPNRQPPVTVAWPGVPAPPPPPAPPAPPAPERPDTIRVPVRDLAAMSSGSGGDEATRLDVLTPAALITNPAAGIVTLPPFLDRVRRRALDAGVPAMPVTGFAAPARTPVPEIAGSAGLAVSPDLADSWLPPAGDGSAPFSDIRLIPETGGDSNLDFSVGLDAHR